MFWVFLTQQAEHMHVYGMHQQIHSSTQFFKHVTKELVFFIFVFNNVVYWKAMQKIVFLYIYIFKHYNVKPLYTLAFC